jgi:hypothetical protein
VIPKKGPPALRLLSNGKSLREVSRDRGKADLKAKLLEFGLDLPRSPGILDSEPLNQLLQLRRELRSAGTALRDPSPIQAEPLAVPPDHRVRLHDDQDLSPARPKPAECDPESSIERSEPWLPMGLGVDGQLLAKGKLHDRLLVAASKESEGRAEQCRDQGQESFHDMGILHEILVWQQSDPALKPAVSFKIGRRVTSCVGALSDRGAGRSQEILDQVIGFPCSGE